MLAIYKKELRSYFTSMLGYVFIAFFLIIIGINFFYENLVNGYANFEYTITNVTFIFVLLVPILTMRLMAEENKQKTDQLLLTSPLSAGAIVVGKFLAVFTIFFLVVAVTLTYPLILKQFGNVPMPGAYASLLGFSMLGGAYLAIGLFISSLTESQMVAAVITFFTFLFTAFMDGIANVIPSNNKTAFIFFSVILIIICLILYFMMHNLIISVTIGLIGEIGLAVIYYVKPTLFDGLIIKVFNWISVISRFDSFQYSILDLSSIVYYISIIVLFLFLTIQVLKKKRWS
ncbi:ABC transporter permease [Mobilitalea sibirica]|uniref:ABC transporter permease n=1 Tax=Mobilitalea sibirica TaxID=1462919 RepID=A0A8J7H5S1_9FIRM|nr:ABC transporter permease [Mobilitalea sibirica]MBH1940321.1 ABC transporter permease [Mobilitalea sibirica]